MDERDCHRSLSDRGRDPLHRLVAYVARCEHAREAGLERQRIPLERPAWAVDRLHVRPGEYEAARIPRDGIPEPARLRSGTDEHEHRRCGQRLLIFA